MKLVILPLVTAVVLYLVSLTGREPIHYIATGLGIFYFIITGAVFWQYAKGDLSKR